ncbi:hypothetical protein ACVXZ4_08365 [Lacisediminihabitans sp. FW035]
MRGCLIGSEITAIAQQGSLLNKEVDIAIGTVSKKLDRTTIGPSEPSAWGGGVPHQTEGSTQLSQNLEMHVDEIVEEDLLAAGQTIRIDPKQEDEVGRAARTLVVSGASNFEAVLGAVHENLLVVGLPTPSEWLAVNGAPHPDLVKLVRKERDSKVYIALGDTEDFETFIQAEKLGKHLTTLGAKTVAFISSNGFELADLLGAIVDKAAYLENMLSGASAGLGRRPKKPTTTATTRDTIAPVVDDEEGLIYRPQDGGKREVLLEASARIQRTYRIYDDFLDPRGESATYMHDLEVVATRDGRRTAREVTSILDEELAQPRRWLNRVPGGTKIVESTATDASKAIAAAIRGFESDLVPEIVVLKRTGYKELENGVIGFAHPAGFATVSGRTQLAKSKLSLKMSAIEIADTAGITTEDERAAAENTLALMEELADPNAWFCLWGPAIHAVAGLGVGAVPVLFGPKGSGKSTIAQAVTGHLTPHFGVDGNTMAAIDHSAKNTAKAGNGLESLFILFDDARKKKGFAGDAQASAVEMVVRPGYAGGSAGYAANVQDRATGLWEIGSPDLSSPMRGIIGEQMPDGDDLASTKERFYPVGIKGNIFRSGNSRKFEELAVNGLATRHLALFIRWVLTQMEDAGSITAWKDAQAKARQKLEDARGDLPVSIRVREVSSVVDHGMQTWFDYLLFTGALTQERRSELGTDCTRIISATALYHGTTNVVSNEVADYEPILNSLRSAVATGQAWIPGWTALNGSVPVVPPTPQSRILGGVVNGRGDNPQFLALLPRDALGVLSTEKAFRDLSERDLLKAFAGQSVTDGGGKLYKTVTLNGLKTKALAIPMTLWTGEVTEADEKATSVRAETPEAA